MAPNKSVHPKKRFAPNDEIILLNGFLELRSETGLNPSKIYSDFYNKYKDKLSVKIDQKQFRDKIGKLNLKYEKNLRKSSLIFSNDHERDLFQLSHKCWGEENSAAADEENVVEDRPIFSGKSLHFDNMFTNLLKTDDINLIGASERAEFDRRYMSLKVQEEKLRVQRAELIQEQLDLIYKGMKGSS